MLSAKNRVFIIKPDGTLPEQGFFACRFGRGALDQAVAVFLREQVPNNLWSLWIDGRLIAESPSWRLAFGPYALMDYFMGRPIPEIEYLKLIKLRARDVQLGIDISAPDINSIPTRI